MLMINIFNLLIVFGAAAVVNAESWRMQPGDKSIPDNGVKFVGYDDPGCGGPDNGYIIAINDGDICSQKAKGVSPARLGKCVKAYAGKGFHGHVAACMHHFCASYSNSHDGAENCDNVILNEGDEPVTLAIKSDGKPVNLYSVTLGDFNRDRNNPGAVKNLGG